MVWFSSVPDGETGVTHNSNAHNTTTIHVRSNDGHAQPPGNPGSTLEKEGDDIVDESAIQPEWLALERRLARRKSKMKGIERCHYE
jgi:type 1 fimbria pilin